MREEGAEASNGRVERNDAVTEGLIVGGGLRNERRGGVLKLLSLLHHSSYFFLQFLCRFRFTHLFTSLLFDFLLSFFFFNSLEILTTDSYCNSNWRLAERPRNRQLYKNTKYTQSQREENEPKKKRRNMLLLLTHSHSPFSVFTHSLPFVLFFLVVGKRDSHPPQTGAGTGVWR